MPRVCLTALLAAACASVPPHEGFDLVSDLAQKRTGHAVYWNQDGPEDAKVAEHVRALVAAPLTPESAVEIALLNNPRLQATFEELGIARADLIQAKLLANPVIGASVGFPIVGPVADIGFAAVQDLIGLVSLPLKKKVAAAQLAATELRVADSILSVAAETRAAYVEAEAAQQAQAMRRAFVEAARLSSELARRQHDAGNVNDLALAIETGQYEQARLDLARGEVDVQIAREKLTPLLGVWSDDPAWHIDASLPELPAQEPSLEQIESLAVERRLDVATARKDEQVAEALLALAHRTRWIGSAQIGIGGERDAEGSFVLGPSLAIEVPVFDHGQGVVARLEAERQQARRRLETLLVAARSEARTIRARLLGARAIVEGYRTSLIPLRERIVALSQQQYNAMQIGTYQLLQAKQAETSAYREYIEAVRDYWVARANLERAVGGTLSEAP